MYTTYSAAWTDSVDCMDGLHGLHGFAHTDCMGCVAMAVAMAAMAMRAAMAAMARNIGGSLMKSLMSLEFAAGPGQGPRKDVGSRGHLKV